MESSDRTALENRPGIFMIGSSNVGKRTLLSRLLSVDFEDASDSSSEVLAHGWTINTKYYTADVSVWMVHLHDEFSVRTLPIYSRLAALVMVFDMSDVGHPVHAEYRRRLLKLEDSYADPHSEFYEFGISETEGSSLLGGEDPAVEIKRSCLEWCTEHNIEYIEACASNADFDKCLSADGDLQGVERLFGALSAYMWPGMILKSGNNITQPALPNKEDLSEEESDYEVEYEVLSAGSAEPWDDTHGDGFLQMDDKEVVPKVADPNKDTETNEVTPFDFEDLEQLMSEIGNMRDNMRFMPDFQRREMAAELAMKMAAMFGGGTDDEEEFD
ncbi:hypothetical protein GH714_028070 [Hevea brasiliensis]|uniref:Uncharacterized protein n=1 Tax=Hevea brasiliensis TaxID=3981 RepID=A0A6A6KU22_HEVBR|nr:hypothetical protein GH714_028070 [Hevea brasiliensis]